MTPDAIRRYFPNASASVLAANAEGAGKTPEPKRVVRNEPLGATQVQEAGRGRFLVILTSVTKRLLDEDNTCAKVHVDLLRYAGVIPEDNPLQTEIRIGQRRARKGEEEGTEIEVYGP